MTKRVMIVGIPGVGKSTVITNVFNLLSQEGIDTKIAEFGKIMFEQAKLLSINNRDQLRKLSIEQQRSLQEMTANYINSLGNDVVINIINPSHLILITAKSEEIHKRRTDDNSRQRDLISIDRISDDLRLSESMISSSSIISGCPFYIIQNNTNEIEKATDDICEVILSK